MTDAHTDTHDDALDWNAAFAEFFHNQGDAESRRAALQMIIAVAARECGLEPAEIWKSIAYALDVSQPGTSAGVYVLQHDGVLHTATATHVETERMDADTLADLIPSGAREMN